MPDEPDLRTQMVVLAAASAAGPVGSDEVAWMGKVADLIPRVAAMVRNADNRPMQRAAEVLEADVFYADYRGYSYEESSTRCVVTIANDRGETETIRTHRTDEGAGKRMRRLLDRLEVGQRILVYKAIETASKNDKVKVRVLVHFEPRRRLPDRGDVGPRHDSPVPHAPGESEIPPAPNRPPDRGPADSPIATRPLSTLEQAINTLSVDQLLAVKRQCDEEKIRFPNPENLQDRHRLDVIIDGVVNGW